MKTKKELSALKEELETVSKKLSELTDEDLKQVTGGITEQELVEIAKLAMIDVSKISKQKLIEDMEQIIQQVTGGGEPTHPVKDDSLYIDEEYNSGVRVI